MKRATDAALTAHSYYEASVVRPLSKGALIGDVEADVAIVGGGFAGLSAAIDLQKRGLRVAVLEAQRIGWGASGRNGGQVIAGLACDMSLIEKQLGATAAKVVWDMSLEAIELVHERRRDFKINCDWQAGFMSAAISARKAQALRENVDSMHARYGYEQTYIDTNEVRHWIASDRFAALAYDQKSGHLHPLKYTLGLARAATQLGASLFENTHATTVTKSAMGYIVHSRDGAVRCKQVLLAGNVYLDQLAPRLRKRIMPVGTYIVASEPLEHNRAQALIPSRAAICDTNFVLDYFRLSADDRVIFGGRVSYTTATPMNLAQSMRQRMLNVFPQLNDVKVTHAWGGFVDITMNRAPDFGRVPEIGSDVYYLQGFSGHGLALTGIAGRIAAEAMAGTSARFDVFAALKHRDFPGGRLLRTPALVAAMSWYKLRDLL